MAAPMMIVPGKNPVLNYIARQMDGIADVLMFSSASNVLWQAQQTPPRVVIADVQLDDMSGAELAEILPNFAPNTRVLICGQATAAMITQIQAVGAEYLVLNGSAADNVAAVYQALDIAPPSSPSDDDLTRAPARATATPAAPSAPVQASAPPVVRPPAPKPATTPTAKPAPTATAKPAIDSAPPPSPKAAPTLPSSAGADDTFGGNGALVIQKQQYQVLTRLLELLAKEVGAEAVVLIDQAGMVLVQSGSLASVVMELVGPMLATSFSTTGQLARHLQEQNTNAAYIHEGDRYDIYAFNVSYRVSLIIMFDKRTNPGKLGTVWVYAKRAMRQLQQILKL